MQTYFRLLDYKLKKEIVPFKYLRTVKKQVKLLKLLIRIVAFVHTYQAIASYTFKEKVKLLRHDCKSGSICLYISDYSLIPHLDHLQYAKNGPVLEEKVLRSFLNVWSCERDLAS